MIEIVFVLAGSVTAAALDWAIYTHLSAYLRAGFTLNDYVNFGDLLCTIWHRCRFALVVASGILAGLAFAVQNSTLWLVALAVFVVGHGLIYWHIFRR